MAEGSVPVVHGEMLLFCLLRRPEAQMKPRPEGDRLANERRGGNVIVRSLRDLGWTQTTFAEHLDIRRATVNDWIKGRSPIPKVVLLYLPLLIRERSRLVG